MSPKTRLGGLEYSVVKVIVFEFFSHSWLRDRMSSVLKAPMVGVFCGLVSVVGCFSGCFSECEGDPGLAMMSKGDKPF